ncbi:hypothetical protein [Duganella callida]|nr:hypothetical protein [Duganella callida]
MKSTDIVTPKLFGKSLLGLPGMREFAIVADDGNCLRSGQVVWMP